MKDAPAGQADASFAEITAKRRGLLRRYLYQRPRVMDGVVVLGYAAGGAHRGGRRQVRRLAARRRSSCGGRSPVLPALLPVALVAFVAVVEVAVTLLHPWGSNVSAGLWFSLYAVAVVHTRRFAW